MNKDLRAFTDQIFGLNSTASSSFGASATGGTRSTTGTSSGAVVLNRLRAETAEFAELAAANQPDHEVLAAKAKVIEGDLLNLQVLGQISDKLCDALIDDLYNAA